MAREDLPVVTGNLEDFLSDVKEAWAKTSGWAIPVAFFIIATIVFVEVLRKRRG